MGKTYYAAPSRYSPGGSQGGSRGPEGMPQAGTMVSTPSGTVAAPQQPSSSSVYDRPSGSGAPTLEQYNVGAAGVGAPQIAVRDPRVPPGASEAYVRRFGEGGSAYQKTTSTQDVFVQLGGATREKPKTTEETVKIETLQSSYERQLKDPFNLALTLEAQSKKKTQVEDKNLFRTLKSNIPTYWDIMFNPIGAGKRSYDRYIKKPEEKRMEFESAVNIYSPLASDARMAGYAAYEQAEKIKSLRDPFLQDQFRFNIKQAVSPDDPSLQSDYEGLKKRSDEINKLADGKIFGEYESKVQKAQAAYIPVEKAQKELEQFPIYSKSKFKDIPDIVGIGVGLTYGFGKSAVIGLGQAVYRPTLYEQKPQFETSPIGNLLQSTLMPETKVAKNVSTDKMVSLTKEPTKLTERSEFKSTVTAALTFSGFEAIGAIPKVGTAISAGITSGYAGGMTARAITQPTGGNIAEAGLSVMGLLPFGLKSTKTKTVYSKVAKEDSVIFPTQKIETINDVDFITTTFTKKPSTGLTVIGKTIYEEKLVPKGSGSFDISISAKPEVVGKAQAKIGGRIVSVDVLDVKSPKSKSVTFDGVTIKKGVTDVEKESFLKRSKQDITLSPEQFIGVRKIQKGGFVETKVSKPESKFKNIFGIELPVVKKKVSVNLGSKKSRDVEFVDYFLQEDKGLRKLYPDDAKRFYDLNSKESIALKELFGEKSSLIKVSRKKTYDYGDYKQYSYDIDPFTGRRTQSTNLWERIRVDIQKRPLTTAEELFVKSNIGKRTYIRQIGSATQETRTGFEITSKTRTLLGKGGVVKVTTSRYKFNPQNLLIDMGGGKDVPIRSRMLDLIPTKKPSRKISIGEERRLDIIDQQKYLASFPSFKEKPSSSSISGGDQQQRPSLQTVIKRLGNEGFSIIETDQGLALAKDDLIIRDIQQPSSGKFEMKPITKTSSTQLSGFVTPIFGTGYKNVNQGLYQSTKLYNKNSFNVGLQSKTKLGEKYNVGQKQKIGLSLENIQDFRGIQTTKQKPMQDITFMPTQIQIPQQKIVTNINPFDETFVNRIPGRGFTNFDLPRFPSGDGGRKRYRFGRKAKRGYRFSLTLASFAVTGETVKRVPKSKASFLGLEERAGTRAYKNIARGIF